MLLKNLYNSITVGIKPTPQFAEVMEAVNTIIRQINSQKDDHRVLYNLKRSTETNIEDMSTTNIELLDTENIQDTGMYSAGISYDSDLYAYTIRNDSAITYVEGVFVNDVLWTKRDFEVVRATGNSNAEIYDMQGRVIYFPYDIGASDNVVKLIVRKCYEPIPAQSDDTGEYVGMPELYYQQLVSGAIYMLTAKDAIAQINKEIYDNLKNKSKSIEVVSSFLNTSCPV
jgi:hypothetical protein